MATMHPEDYLERYAPQYSERKLYEALRDQLPGNCHVFYSTRWFAEKLDSEADFVIVDPDRGFLCVEVKGGLDLEAPETEDSPWILTEKVESRSAGDGAEYRRARRRLRRSPYRQAENSMIYLRDCFEGREGGGRPKREYRGVYGFAVALPMFNPDFTKPTVPRELTITRDDIEQGNLRRRVGEIFDFCGRPREQNLRPGEEAGIRGRIGKTQRLNLGPQQREFIQMLEEDQGLRVAAGALVDIKEREFAQIDFVQDSLLDMIQNYRRARIYGGAGSGKTFIAMKKALRDLGRLNREGEGRRVLLLSCSQELMDFTGGWMEQRLRREKEDWAERLSRCRSCTYETLVREVLGEECRLPQDRRGNPIGCEDLVRAASGRQRYDTILVDEGQDFSAEMGRVVRLFLREEEEQPEDGAPELYVFYDPDQDTAGSQAGLRIARAFEIAGPPFVLSRNLRNTGRIYDYAKRRSGKGLQTKSNTLLGVEPRLYPSSVPGSPDGAAFYSDEDQCRRKLDAILRELTDRSRGQVDAGSIVLLADDPYEESLLAGREEIGGLRVADRPLGEIREGELCFRTVERFKGLEANVVIYLENVRGREEDLDELERSRERSKAYIALTRARYFLYVLRIKRG